MSGTHDGTPRGADPREDLDQLSGAWALDGSRARS